MQPEHKISSRHRGYQLFGEEITHGELASWLRNGAEIRGTQLGDEFDFEAYMAKHEKRVIPLFALDNKKRLWFFVIEGKMKPESGWMIISLIQPGELENKNQVTS